MKLELRKLQLGRSLNGPEELLIKRRLVPVRLRISQKGVYRKLQVSTRGQKVIGIIISQRLLPDMPMAAYYRYYGVGGTGQTSEAFIKSLTRQEIRTKVGQAYINAGVGEKVYIAQPVRLGIPVIRYNDVEGGFFAATVVSVTNDTTQHTEDYFLYESVNVNLGSLTFELS
jgi:hypothetical protein